MLAEVVSQIATLAEDGLAPLVLATEIELSTLSLTVEDFYRLVPLLWDPCEMLGKGSFPVDGSWIFEIVAAILK